MAVVILVRFLVGVFFVIVPLLGDVVLLALACFLCDVTSGVEFELVVVVPLSDLELAELFFAMTGKKSNLGIIPIVTIEDKRIKQIVRTIAGLFILNTSNGVIYTYPCDSHAFLSKYPFQVGFARYQKYGYIFLSFLPYT